MGRMMVSPVWGNVNREVITEHLEDGTWDPTFPEPCEYYAYARDYGVTGCKHPGLDVSMPEGTPVYAARAGTVARIRNPGVSGRIEVVVRDANGHEHLYNHLSKSIVSEGAAVSSGQQIGNSGTYNSPHLHVEHRVPDTSTSAKWSFVHPEPLLTSNAPIGFLPKYRNGDEAFCSSGPLNLREAMSTTSSILDVIPTGGTMGVLRGPFTSNGYRWWRVKYAGKFGYVVDNFIALRKAGGTAAATSGFASGQNIKCVDGPVNFRQGPFTTADVVGSISVGEVVNVLSRSSSTDGGYVWYEAKRSNGATGYCVGKFFAAA